MITWIKETLFSYQTLLSLIMLWAVGFIVFRALDLPFRSPVKSLILNTTQNILNRNEGKMYRRKQRESISPTKGTVTKRYRLLVSNISESLEMGVSVENFNLLILSLAGVAFFFLYFFIENFFLAALCFFPIVCAIFVTFLKITKHRMRAKENAIMNAKDLICPTIDKGVTNSIKMNIESIDPRIRGHFYQFLFNYEQLNKPFDECMDELEERLGPGFSSFARKAKIFEFGEKEGMAKLFMDEVEMNKVQRTANYRMDEAFVEINKGMIYSIGIILLFLGWMYTNPMTAEAMKTTILGKITTSVSITTVLAIYTLNQLNQLNIDFSKIEKDARKASK